MRRQVFMFLILQAFLTVLVFAVGLLAGQWRVLHPFGESIAARNRTQYLAAHLDKAQREKILSSYYADGATADTIGKSLWNVPYAIAPFVGTAACPGEYGSGAINSMLCRNSEQLAIPRPRNEYRVFIVGGSAAFGVGAPSQERTIGAYLERELARGLREVFDDEMVAKVWTLATPGWCSTHERIMIENRICEFSPHWVFAFSGINEVHWGSRGENVMWFRTLDDNNVFQLLSQLQWKAAGTPLVDILPVPEAAVAPQLVADRLGRNVASSAFALSAVGARYTFVLQPTLYLTGKERTKWEKRRHGLESPNYFSLCYEAMRQSLGKIQACNFSWLDLTPVFDNCTSDVGIFLDNYHLGDRGNELVAKAMANTVLVALSKTPDALRGSGVAAE